jgi:hypothetical protein
MEKTPANNSGNNLFEGMVPAGNTSGLGLFSGMELGNTSKIAESEISIIESKNHLSFEELKEEEKPA